MIKHSILLKIQKYDGNLCGLASIVYTKFLIKKPSGDAFKSEIISNQDLAEKLHKLSQLLENLINEKYTHLL